MNTWVSNKLRCLIRSFFCCTRLFTVFSWLIDNLIRNDWQHYQKWAKRAGTRRPARRGGWAAWSRSWGCVSCPSRAAPSHATPPPQLQLCDLGLEVVYRIHRALGFLWFKMYSKAIINEKGYKNSKCILSDKNPIIIDKDGAAKNIWQKIFKSRH